MKINKAGMDMIKSFEGLRLTAYLDEVQVPTIGWGCTEGVTKQDVIDKRTITQEQATQMLLGELEQFENGVPKLVKVPLNENEYSALVSFCYNLGLDSLRKSTLLKLLNAGNKAGASLEFEKWNHAGGKVLNGLTRRRIAEKALFLKPVDAPAPGTNPPVGNQLPDGPSDQDINVTLEEIENEVLKK